MSNSENLMSIENGYVCIPVEEYVDLIETNQFFDVLLDTLFMNARLSWNETSLSFDDGSLGVILRAYNSRRYDGTINRLQKLEKAGEENDKDKE